MDAVIARKREIHPELSEALTWGGFLSVCDREGVTVLHRELPRNAMLVNWDGAWCIVINSAKSSPRHDTADGAHELAHFWFHVDETPVGRALCYNHGYGDDPDPREDEADYGAAAMLYGPKYFPSLAPVAVLGQMQKASELGMPDLSEVEIRGEDNFPVLAKRTGFLASQAALSAIFAAGNPDGRELDIEASLIPEQANVHDSKAVRIDVGSKGVGYLASEDARVYRRRWGRRPSRVAARIISKPHPSFPAMDVYTLRLDLPLR